MGASNRIVEILIFGVMILDTLIGLSVSAEDCRVLSDCNGQTRWQKFAHETQGLRVNITELRELLLEGKKGPLFFSGDSSVTWHTSKTFCRQFDRTLCTMDEICPRKGASREFILDVIPGDHWVAVRESVNEWVEIGDYHVLPCIYHKERWGPPAWGLSTDQRSLKGYIFCCEADYSDASINSPDVRYQYIGQTATYASSSEHCAEQGRRLCYSSEVCSRSLPVMGLIKGDKWIAVHDRFNEWIQIGDSKGHTCKTHGVLFGLPSWGTREDGSLRDWVGYVYCCSNTAFRRVSSSGLEN